MPGKRRKLIRRPSARNFKAAKQLVDHSKIDFHKPIVVWGDPDANKPKARMIVFKGKLTELGTATPAAVNFPDWTKVFVVAETRLLQLLDTEEKYNEIVRSERTARTNREANVQEYAVGGNF